MKSILSRRSFISRTPLLVLASFVAVNFAARAAATDTKQYNLGADKIALQGHDPVAYIAQNKAAKGSKEFSATRDGVVVNPYPLLCLLAGAPVPTIPPSDPLPPPPLLPTPVPSTVPPNPRGT